MKKWARLVITLSLATALATAGLTSASANSGPNGGPMPPDSGKHQAVASDAPAVVHPHSSRPPSQAESVFVAVTPCRIVDTRVSGNPFGNGTIRTYYVGGNFGFTAQGGNNGGCGIPIGATAVAATVTAVVPTKSGYFKAWPQNLSEPNSTLLNYPVKQSAGSGGTIPIQKNSALSLRVKNYGGPTDIVIDVTGYYAQQMEGMVASDGSIYSGTDRLLSATLINPGVYRVTWDTDVSNCTPTVNPYSGQGVYASAYNFAGTSTYVYTWYISHTTHLEVPNSYYFYITVTC